MKIDLKNINWDKVEKEAQSVIWLGIVALMVFLSSVVVTMIFWVMPIEGKIFLGILTGFIAISGLFLRYVLGYGEN